MRSPLKVSGTLAPFVGMAVCSGIALSSSFSGCGNGGTAADAQTDAPTDAQVDAQAPTDDAHPATLPIKHVVFLVKENRTFDVYFGKFPGANGATTGKMHTGATVELQPLIDKNGPLIHHC
jgi:phospholipase C